MTTATIAEPRMLTRTQLAKRLGYSVAHFDRLRAAGRLPLPVRVSPSPKAIRWPAEEIDAWVANRKPDGSTYTAAEWAAVWPKLRGKKG